MMSQCRARTLYARAAMGGLALQALEALHSLPQALLLYDIPQSLNLLAGRHAHAAGSEDTVLAI